MITSNPTDLLRVEHMYRMKNAQLDEILKEMRKLAEVEGRLRCELQRLENDRYRLLAAS